MTTLKTFIFNPFQENTFVLYDDSKDCLIIDPGCHSSNEQSTLISFIRDENLNPVMLLNTHCHVDHIIGNRFIYETYGLKPILHRDDLQLLENGPQIATLFGFDMEPSPEPESFITEEDTIKFGNSQELQIIHTPGHSQGSVTFHHVAEKWMIAGDVLFLNSIGRTDFPESNHDDLMHSIIHKLFPLGDDITVHPGHGPSTTIGHEKRTNPFVLEYQR